MDKLLDLTLYFIALINPVSKIFVLTVLARETGHDQLRRISLRSSAVALGILFVFAGLGNFILVKVFHVDLYSFKVAGGAILFFIGYKALSRGTFFEVDAKEKLGDVSIVPIASPMIAGPATITACVSFSAAHGFTVTALAMAIAVAVNLLCMLMAERIGNALMKQNLMGALIRITGLVVATIAVQMVFGGVGEWWGAIQQK
jgi:multiple antibiotic resistance protein